MGERAAKGGRQMQVSEGSDTFEFRSPHGMKAAHSRLRTFAGIAVRHPQHFNHPGRAWHDLSGPQDTLTVVLAEIGVRCEARTNLHRPAALERQRPNHISFVPAEMRVWGYTDNMECVRELRLSFDRKSLGDWFGTDLDPGKSGNPELMFHDKRAVECARLLAAECDASDPSTGLYGEGLTIAIAALDTIESLKPVAAIAGHKRLGAPDTPNNIEATRKYIRDFDRIASYTKTALDLYSEMLAIYPERVNPAVLWYSAQAVKPGN